MRPQRGQGRADRRPQARRQARRPPRRKVNRPARRGHLGHPGLTLPPRRASRNRARPRGRGGSARGEPPIRPAEPGSAGTGPRPRHPRPTRPQNRSPAGEPRPPTLAPGADRGRGRHLLVAGRRWSGAEAGCGRVEPC